MAENKEHIDGQVEPAEVQDHELDVAELANADLAELKYPDGFSKIAHESRVETVLGLADQSKQQILKLDGYISRSFWTAV